MKNHLLQKLKALQKVRSDTKAFANHDEFLPWSDSVTPLLEFDVALSKKFIFWSDHLKSAYRMGREHYDAQGECIGVVNQAIIKLELQSEKDSIGKEDKISEVPYPNKFTLMWLYQHAPISLWGWLIGLLISAFVLGIGFSETQLYRLLKNKPSESVVQGQGLNKAISADAKSRAAE
jgi:hypothetical protein